MVNVLLLWRRHCDRFLRSNTCPHCAQCDVSFHRSGDCFVAPFGCAAQNTAPLRVLLAMTLSEWHVAVFLGRRQGRFVAQEIKRGDEARARLTRRNDVVDVAAGCRVIGLANFSRNSVSSRARSTATLPSNFLKSLPYKMPTARPAKPYCRMKGKISAISTPAAMTDATCPAVLAPMACIKIKF